MEPTTITTAPAPLTAVRQLIALADQLGRPFNDEDINAKWTPTGLEIPWYEAAADYVRRYRGDNDFIIDVQARFTKYGSFRSDRVVRAVLNRMVRDVQEHRAASNPQPASAAPAAPADDRTPVADGYYTVINKGHSTTLQLETKTDGKFKGKQIASYLNGPDNTSNYQGFAFVTGRTVRTWQRFRSNENLTAALDILLNAEDYIAYGEAYALQSNNCFRCHRLLTVEGSITRGMGSTCAAKMGF